MTRTLEVILSPATYPFRTTTGSHITVVIDVLRFTTSLIAAFDNGVNEVIPVSSLKEAESLKKQGYQVAAERDGLRLPFADFGNSAADFNSPDIKGKTLVYSTTNGTVAMTMAEKDGPVVAASFTNLNAVAEWLTNQDSDVVILCSGWKNLSSMEDTLCAGALAASLIESGSYTTDSDSAGMALHLWKIAKHKLADFIENASHYTRLINLGVDPMLTYTLKSGISKSVPVFEKGRITNKSISDQPC